jgi:predicted O-methyltransferase YrrM
MHRHATKMPRVRAILKRSPRAHKAAFAALSYAQAVVDAPRYLMCRWANKVYIGPVMSGRQTWSTRVPHMLEAIREELRATRDEEFRVLEIGTWAGQSALLWAEEIRRAGRSGKVFCVDPWLPFASNEQTGINNAVLRMSKIAAKDQIFPLFWHNVRAAKLTDFIVPVRGRSCDVLPALAPETFNIVFVDGSHFYRDFIQDLRLAMSLVRTDGIVCGDDLELQFEEVDQRHARKNCDRDFVTDPKTDCEFHPGVTVGVFDVFQRRIGSRDGFWLQRKSPNGWCDAS